MSGLLQNFCKDEQMYLLERRLFSKYDDNIIIIDLRAIMLQVDRFSLAFWLVRTKIYRKKGVLYCVGLYSRESVCVAIKLWRIFKTWNRKNKFPKLKLDVQWISVSEDQSKFVIPLLETWWINCRRNSKKEFEHRSGAK